MQPITAIGRACTFPRPVSGVWDWAKVVSAFGEIYPSLPGLMDASKMTATERFRLASISYGDDLYNKEQYCDAQKQYENGLALGDDVHGKEMLSKASEYCANPPNDNNNHGRKPDTDFGNISFSYE
jgi:hypothetical protein